MAIGERYGEILEAACESIARRGFHQASIRVRPNRQIVPPQSPWAAPGVYAPAMSTVTPPPFFQGARR